MTVQSTNSVAVRSMLEGTSNTRDLGGCRTTDGHVVRRGLILRSDALTALTDADRRVLREMNLKVLVDLRTQHEIKWHGSNVCEPTTRLVHAPFIDDIGDTLAFALSKAFNEHNAEAIVALLGGGRVYDLVNNTAVRFIEREATRTGIAETMQLLADGQAPLMFVCRAGKDRAGFLAAVILRTLGVSESDIIAGYTLSNDYLDATNQEMFSILRSAGVDPEIVRPLIEQQPHVMESFFAEVIARHGTWQNYLTDHLGLAADVTERLRSQYLDPLH